MKMLAAELQRLLDEEAEERDVDAIEIDLSCEPGDRL
jgi:hypothetical protein